MKSTANARDLLRFGLLLALLALLTTAAAIFETRQEDEIRLDSESAGRSGALALALWLESLGYDVRTEAGTEFSIPEDADLVFLLEPGLADSPTDDDLALLEEWVNSGGVLVFASENPGFSGVAEHFGFNAIYLSEPVPLAAAALPVFTRPPLTDPVPIHAQAYLDAADSGFLPLIAVPEGPLVAMIPKGEGAVILSAGAVPFTNAGLKEPGSAEFVLNLTAGLPEGAVIWFDEWHHGKRAVSLEGGGPGNWLRATPAGRAVFYAGAVAFAWVVISGRRFGRPQNMPGEDRRRAPLEYVNAIADINRAAGNRQDLTIHYIRQFKRRTGRRYHIDPALPDEAFCAALRMIPDPNAEAAAALLAELAGKNLTEEEMILRIGESVSTDSSTR